MLGPEPDPYLNGGVEGMLQLEDLFMSSVGGALTLSYDGTIFDTVAWPDGAGGTLPNGLGASVSLNPDALDASDNDDLTRWCRGMSAFGDGDLGTPGAANDACPTGVDMDGDGYYDDDCDDTDATVNPGAAEVLDGLDNDCDDLADEGFWVEGDLIITELGYNPSSAEPDTEWFEIYNPSPTLDRALDGLLVESTSSSGRFYYVAPGTLTIPADDYLVLCYGDSVLSTDCDYVYGSDVNPASSLGATFSASFSLGNTGPVTVTLSMDGDPIDDVAYGTSSPWPSSSNGYAVGLDPTMYDPVANDDGENWCHETSTYGTGDTGTPGLENDACFTTVTDADGDGFDDTTDCDDTDATIHPGASELDDEIDQDCDDVVDEGFCVAGDIVITEIMYNPSGSEPVTEWFEVFNPSTTDTLALDGLLVYSSSSSGRSFYVAPGALEIGPLDMLVFCHGDTTLSTACDYVYGSDVNDPSSQGVTYNSSFSLGNSGPITLTLSVGGVTLDSVAYGTSGAWPSSTNGKAIGLDPTLWDSVSNDDGANWCHAVSTYSGTDTGTPGTLNDACL